jgi:hypothetical protein
MRTILHHRDLILSSFLREVFFSGGRIVRKKKRKKIPAKKAQDVRWEVVCVCVLTWLPARGGRLAARVYRDTPRAPPPKLLLTRI